MQTQTSFHHLEPAAVSQRCQDEPQVDMGLIQPGLRKMGPQERDVKLAAVERDHERKLPDVSGEPVQVHAADEQSRLAAAERPDHGHFVVVGGEARRLDVEEHGPVGEFRYANELVEFIRAETDSAFHIEVAAYPEFHPEAPTAEADIDNFVRKVKAGANAAITQYFFNADAYYRFIDACEQRGLDLPIVPGIMPITNYKQLARFSDACGAEIPRWIRRRLEGYGDDLDAIRAFGLDVTTELCRQLLDAGAPGLHFYTLNRAGPTCTVWERLGL